MITLPPGYRALVLDEIDSTNEEAKRQAEDGAPGGLFILARMQTAGRGRRGREWVSPKGNFHSSLLLRPAVSARRAAELSFVAANAVADVFETLGVAQPQVKWPNDVLIADAKAAGILLESSVTGSVSLDWLTVGIGLNLARAPHGTPYPATALAHHTGRPAPDPLEVLPVLAATWKHEYDTWQSQGFAPIRAKWLSRAANLGGRVTARLEAGDIEGRFMDLSETGELILETAQGLRSISAGEVFFARSN